MDWKEELNKELFSGIPMEEMGSNQIGEEKLQRFIETQIIAAEERGREKAQLEIRNWAKSNTLYRPLVDFIDFINYKK